MRGPINYGVWNHISVVIDANMVEATITLYVDGVLVASQLFVNTLFDAINDQQLLFGGLQGDIDEVRLFTFARNRGARSFYERHGFRIVRRGFEPDWQLDDLEYEWRRTAAD